AETACRHRCVISPPLATSCFECFQVGKHSRYNCIRKFFIHVSRRDKSSLNAPRNLSLFSKVTCSQSSPQCCISNGDNRQHRLLDHWRITDKGQFFST